MDTAALTRIMIEHYKSQEALAAAVGVGQSSVARWLRGGEVAGKNLLRLIDLARDVPAAVPIIGSVTTPSLVRDVGAFKPDIVPGLDLVGDKNLPVYAAAMGGDGHQIITFEAIDYVKRPAILENVKNPYGVYIVGESMIPAYDPGDMALINPYLPPARDRDVVLFHTPPAAEAECIIKRLLSYSERDWRLRQYNPAKDFVESRVDWPICHRVVGKYGAR